MSHPGFAPSGLPYHRRFTVRPEPGRIEAHMQDFCHHVRVVVTHEAGRIVEAFSEGIRLPWNTCPLGAAGVGRIAGLTVDEARNPANWPGGRTANCVHATDVALVALNHAFEREPFTYAISVSPASGRIRSVRLERNDVLAVEWTVKDSRLTAPEELAGRSLNRPDFDDWSGQLPPQEREWATVLRRACHIAPSRDIDLDACEVAVQSIGAPDSSCLTLQPGVAETARRVRGSSRGELTDLDRI